MHINATRRGFTLIELLVVVAIIGILASIILASLTTARGKANNATRLAEIHQLQNALTLYYNQFGTYPAPAADIGGFACSGWDTTYDGSFIPSLSANGFFPTLSKTRQIIYAATLHILGIRRDMQAVRQIEAPSIFLVFEPWTRADFPQARGLTVLCEIGKVNLIGLRANSKISLMTI
jgi:prepilin-type N-terminal cleavage/methylation domain-containing protein